MIGPERSDWADGALVMGLAHTWKYGFHCTFGKHALEQPSGKTAYLPC